MLICIKNERRGNGRSPMIRTRLHAATLGGITAASVHRLSGDDDMADDGDPDSAARIIFRARAVLEAISDPELPMLSIVDLGILRDILPFQGGVEVLMLPTYPGCPALDMIALEIHNALTASGIFPVKVTMVTSPTWSTDLMSPDALHKLSAAGIAPPERGKPVVCPKCLSATVEEVNPFGATACRAIWRCTRCSEGFDRFKCH